MGGSKSAEFEELLRRLAEAPAAEAPSIVRPGIILADRLEVEQQLGAGGMGRVFAAYDRVRQGRVAVKVLGSLTPRSILRLKREFRSVADLVHPNLVRCHELISDGVEWFFTMDLVDGVTLPAFLKGSQGEPRWDALRRVLRELAQALNALHEAGLLHGDLKPSNFLIARRDQRVVLLDFGLARPIGPAARREGVAGTPGYMAPEQRLGKTLTEAVDWYAFGVVLYQALAGELPGEDFSARGLSETPEDLARLCFDLLQVQPTARPSAEEVLRRISPQGEPPPPRTAPATPRPIFIGRKRELEALDEAFQVALGGTPSIALLLGPSGIGKTSLAAAFLDEARDRGCQVLGGSCRERESMPYKAVDGLIDDLASILDSLPRDDLASALPDHFTELTILFPGLRDALAAPTPVADSSDQTVVKLRAIAAFGQLLANLRRRAPLILWIDDMQWSDAESALLLGPILGGPEPVPLMLLGGCRTTVSGAASTAGRQVPTARPGCGPMLEALLADRNLVLPGAREMALAPLGSADAERLALELLPRDEPGSRATASEIAQEAEGHPLFITELAHSSKNVAGRPHSLGSTTLQDLVVRRVAALPPEARRLLEVVAVAGAPLARIVLRKAQNITFAEAEACLDLLRTNRLARTQGLSDEDGVDVHHDRIREIVFHGLSETVRKRYHLALAQVLELGNGQPDFVAAHYEGAGDLVRASRHWLLAAEQAARALAFGRAADLYEKAILHAQLEPGAVHDLKIRRAEALARAGRRPAAADVYLGAAEGCAREEAVELRRRAAEQLLLAGHIGKGLAVIEEVLRAIGMRGTRSGSRGLLSFAVGRLRVRARGLGHRTRGERELSREELVKLDATWTIASSLGWVEFVRGADFHNEHVLLALRAGEPTRLLRALAIEAAYSATPGIGSERRTAHLLNMASALAGASADATAVALLSVARGVSAYLQGRLEQALVHLEGAMDLLAHSGAGVQETAQRFLIASLFFLGRFRRLGELVPPLLAEAEATGNIYAAMCCRTGYSSVVWLTRDDVREARKHLQRAREEWAGAAFLLPHLNILIGETYLDLYAGDAERALARLGEQWPRMRQAQLLRIAVVRAQVLQLRSACAAAVADKADGHGQRARASELRRGARADLKDLRRERVMRAAPWAALVEAALASSDGDDPTARDCLQRALQGFDQQGMQLFAAAARVRIGERASSPEGQSVAQAGYQAFEREGVMDPLRMVGMLAPGFG